VRNLYLVKLKATPIGVFAKWITSNYGCAIYILARYITRRRKFVFIATAHKVGSTWLFNLLKDAGRFEKAIVPKQDLYGDAIDLKNPALLNWLSSKYGYYINKTRSYPIDYDIPRSMNYSMYFVTMIRDPRDVIVSASYYLAYLDTEKSGWGRNY